MKYLSVASKAVIVLLTAAMVAACSSSSKKDEDDAAAKKAQDAATAAQAEERQRAQAAAAEQQRLLDAATSYGSVFYFDFDSYTLQPEAIEALNAYIEYFKANEEPVRLEGHTDERGTREYNMALGERRANAVRDYMVVNGIPSYRIETVSYGEERPVSMGSGESNWSQNRRVELK